MKRYLKYFPYVDIFIAHNPTESIHDIKDNVHNGFKAFREYIENVKPRLFLHGHSGMNKKSYLGETMVIAVFGKRVINF